MESILSWEDNQTITTAIKNPNDSMKVLITAVPFGEKNQTPLKLLEKAGIDYLVNPLCRKPREEETAEMVADFDVIIAGTERITDEVMRRSARLKLISRIGIGLDGIDLRSAKRREIRVCNTPDAPSQPVAEFVISSMLTLLRFTHISNLEMHRGKWNRYIGRNLSECTVGLIGVGRIGKRILSLLESFNCKRILINDIKKSDVFNDNRIIKWCNKESIYREADIISVNVPLTEKTRNMIRREHLISMKSDTAIINTSRGGIVNESDLYDVMHDGHLAGAAIDVFENEPYNGPLMGIERCVLTPHLASMTIGCRTRMEIEATEEAIRFLKGEPLLRLVPEDEYLL